MYSRARDNKQVKRRRLLEDPLAIDGLLGEIVDALRTVRVRGKPARYIPALRAVDPSKLGMAFAAVSGIRGGTGDADVSFSIQSISKLFATAYALQRGGDEIWRRVGKEPTGSSFNSVGQLELDQGIPRNPFVNAGAMVVTDLLFRWAPDPSRLVCDFLGSLAMSDAVRIDPVVAASEMDTAHVNRALAHVMRSRGTIRRDAETVVRAYIWQCATEMTCAQLALAALPFASDGHHPLVDRMIFGQRTTRRINSLLLTCGMYESVGSFAYRVGLPAKSGVGGGIVAIAPGLGAVAVWSPGLDRSGNSELGIRALELFVEMTGCSLF